VSPRNPLSVAPCGATSNFFSVSNAVKVTVT
jgi:hypothetical protein